MKIAILGGSFDPPHLGHLFIAIQVREMLSLDQVWFMPLYQHSTHAKIFHKKMSSVAHRLAMTKLMENECIVASDFEIQRNRSSYTADTLDQLAALRPNDSFFWIMGSDQLESFQSYHKWHEILARHAIIIFPRESALPYLKEKVKKTLLLQTIPENVIVLDDQELLMTNISSTRIRIRARNRLTIQPFVTKKVEEYILEHKLYVTE